MAMYPAFLISIKLLAMIGPIANIPFRIKSVGSLGIAYERSVFDVFFVSPFGV